MNNEYFLLLRKQNPNKSILFSVMRDDNLMKNMLEKFERYFYKILLPEAVTVTRKFDISNENGGKT